jgi:hypothetical protein
MPQPKNPHENFASRCFEHRQVIVKGVPHMIPRPLVENLPRVRGRVKIREPVGEVIKIGEVAEVAADIHRLVEQRQLWIGGECGNGRAQRDDCGGGFLECGHGLKLLNVSLPAGHWPAGN